MSVTSPKKKKNNRKRTAAVGPPRACENDMWGPVGERETDYSGMRQMEKGGESKAESYVGGGGYFNQYHVILGTRQAYRASIRKEGT